MNPVDVIVKMRIILFSISFAAYILAPSSCVSPKENTEKAVMDSTGTNVFFEINEKIKANPDDADLYYQRALKYFDSQDIQASYNDISRALKLDSSNASYYLLLGDIHFIKKEGIKAKEILNKCLGIDPQNTEAYLKLAEIFFLVEQYATSIEHINKALKIDAHLAKAYFMKGMNYKYSGDTAKAISSMQTAVEQDNDYYDAYIQLGLLYSAKHDSMAINYFDNALRLQGASIEALYGKSLFLQEHGQPERAIAGYEHIIEINPEFRAIAYFNIGYTYLVHLEKYPEAKDNFTHAIEQKPDYFEAWCNRGIAYEKMSALASSTGSGQGMTPLQKRGELLKNAEADFRKALQIKPDYTPAAKGISRVVDKDFD